MLDKLMNVIDFIEDVPHIVDRGMHTRPVKFTCIFGKYTTFTYPYCAVSSEDIATMIEGGKVISDIKHGFKREITVLFE